MSMVKYRKTFLTAVTVCTAFTLSSVTTASIKASAKHHQFTVKTVNDGNYYKAAKTPHKKHNVEIPEQTVHHPQQPAPAPAPQQNLQPAPVPQQPAQTNDAVDGNIAQNAEKMVGYFNYGQVRPVQRYVTKAGHQLNTVDDVDPNGMTDCSGFVWLTLKVSGYNVGGFSAGSTENIKHLNGGWGNVLEEIPRNQAQPGDIVVVSAGNGNGGHTGILDGSYNGNDLVNSDTPFINVSDGTHACKRGPIKWYFATLKHQAPTHVFRVKPSARVNN